MVSQGPTSNIPAPALIVSEPVSSVLYPLIRSISFQKGIKEEGRATAAKSAWPTVGFLC